MGFSHKLTGRLVSQPNGLNGNLPGKLVFGRQGEPGPPGPKGDTLWDIAKAYLGNGSRYPEIKTLNNLTSNVIYSGWKLKIPN